MKIFLDSAKAGLLENVKNHFSKYFGSRKISKTNVGSFFKHPVGWFELWLSWDFDNLFFYSGFREKYEKFRKFWPSAPTIPAGKLHKQFYPHILQRYLISKLCQVNNWPNLLNSYYVICRHTLRDLETVSERFIGAHVVFTHQLYIEFQQISIDIFFFFLFLIFHGNISYQKMKTCIINI